MNITWKTTTTTDEFSTWTYELGTALRGPKYEAGETFAHSIWIGHPESEYETFTWTVDINNTVIPFETTGAKGEAATAEQAKADAIAYLIATDTESVEGVPVRFTMYQGTFSERMSGMIRDL